MDSDSYRPFYLTFNKPFLCDRDKYSSSPKKTSKPVHQKPQQINKSQYKTPSRTNNPANTMNQLAPRFQQRAIYSQYYRTDYESSWRANLLAASYRTRCNSKKPVVKVIHLGERPDPEGAPSCKVQEYEPPKDCIDYDTVLNNDISLYSDYGSDYEDPLDQEASTADSEQNAPNASWSTASLLTHAFNKASSNKVTVMSYAVIGAELNSINKLHTTKTENDLSRLTKKTLRLTENIDNARKSLKDIAFGLRSLKQDIKSKNKKLSSTKERSLKHSSAGLLSQPELSFAVDDTDKRLCRRRPSEHFDQPPFIQNSNPLMNYCTIGRRHKSRQASQPNCFSDPKFSMMKCVNMNVSNKRSSSDEY